MKELVLTEIWVYPIKSLGGIRLHKAKVMPKGLQFDRRWMLVDENGEFMTQRVYPIMALFKVSFESDQLLITYKNQSITVSLNHQYADDAIFVKIWNDDVSVFEVSEAHSNWFSQILNMKCKLVYFPEENPRQVDPIYKINDEHVGLADAYPFLIIGQRSLDDLNERLKENIPMNRFRPNLVFKGGEAFEEDDWKNFIIGENRFVAVKPCARCILTTINQNTAEKGVEPLKTLATYRTTNNKIYFGQNLVALDFKEISVGDTITLN